MPYNCTGEPTDYNFFNWDSTDSVYNKRHAVLFNLYSYDVLHASPKLVDPPQLIIKNCNFTYFLDSYEALILIETNNIAKKN